MEPLPVCLVGCGGIARYYAAVIQYLPQLAIAAVVDPNKDNRSWAASTFGAEPFSSLDECLDKAHFEAGIVASPVFLHQAHVEALAAHEKAVFCEKPMARTTEECDGMIDACTGSDVPLMVGLMKRFNPCFVHIGRMLQDGVLGNLFQVDCFWTSWTYQPTAGWRDSLETLGGCFQDHGSATPSTCAIYG